MKGREERWENEEVFPFFDGKEREREWWISEEKQRNEKGIGLYIVEKWVKYEKSVFVSVWNWKMTQRYAAKDRGYQWTKTE